MNADDVIRDWHTDLMKALSVSKITPSDLHGLAVGYLGEAPGWLTQAVSGGREPSADEYLVLASLTSVPLPVLVGAVDPGVSVGVALRAGTVTALPADTEAICQRGIELIEASRLVNSWFGADSLDRSDALDTLRATRSRVAFAPKAGKQTAEQVRTALWRLNLLEKDGPIDDLVSLVESLGIPVELSKDLPEGIHGLTVNDQSMGAWDAAIIIRVDDFWVRQRYTLAHELCHVIYQDSSMISVNDESTEASTVEIERRAESFARHFLAPDRQAKRVWKTHAGGGVVKALCEFILNFGISRQAAVNTIQGLGLIDSSEAGVLKAASVQGMMLSSGLGDPWKQLVDTQAEPSASVWLLESALGLYEQGLVPASTIASILGQPLRRVEEDLAAQGWESKALGRESNKS